MISTAILMLAAISPSADDDAKTFQGKWTFTSVQVNGEKVADADLGGLELSVEDDGYKHTKAGIVLLAGKFQFFPDKSPKEVDLTITEGEHKGKTRRGIYKFEGETVTFCVAEPDSKVRPTEFTSEQGSDRTLAVLKKVK